MQLVRSLLFTALIYPWMAVIGIVYFPWTLVSSNGAFAAAHAWSASVVFLLRHLVGLKTEVRGTPPEGEVMIAAKHQSFLDIILIFHALPRGKFIMKRELMYAPVIGQYGLRMGAVPVARGKRGQAIAKMVEDVEKGRQEPGQLIIYPQGTRLAPGVIAPYKVGTGILYKQLNQTVVPVATNVGHFWPRRGWLKRPGLGVVEFLDPIPPGLDQKEFLARLETAVETASDRLSEEAHRSLEAER